MELSYYENGQAIVVKLEGDLTSDSSEAFKNFILHLVQEGHQKLVLDCKQLENITSSGVQAIAVLLASKEMQGIKIAACNIDAQVEQVLTFANMTTNLMVYDDIEQATKGVGG